MSLIHRLTGAAFGTHFADQVALIAVPLVAVLAFDAPAEVVGILVACQSMAHLLGSLPFGILIDRHQLRSLAIASALISLVGFASAASSIVAGSLLWFGVAITIAGFGVVLFGLTALSILPRIVKPGGLASANATLEIPRALCSFAVPLGIGLIVLEVPAWTIFATACIGSTLALGLSQSLPRFDVSPKQGMSLLTQVSQGARYVVRHRLLLPISLCAVFWNFGFAALLVVLVSAIRDLYQIAPGSFGIALSAFGLAAVCGSWLARQFAGLVTPSLVLLFGPGSSIIAAGGLLLIGPETAEYWIYACFFLLGFGPSMWLVAQNSVRQLVTPANMLGCVNAVIQTSIYGIRPLGALTGGIVTGAFGPAAGLVLVVLAFLVSFAVSAFSGLRTVTSYETLAVPETP